MFRLAGTVLVVGAVLSVVGYVLGSFAGEEPVTPAMVHTPLYVVSNLLVFAGQALTLVGLPGLVARQYERSRKLTVIGAIGLAMVTLLNGVCNTFGDLTLYPMLVDNPATRAAANGNPPPILAVFFILGMLGAAVGAIVMAIAMFRATVFAKWIRVVMLVTVVASPLSSLGGALTSNLAAILGSIALLGIGVRVASAGGVASEIWCQTVASARPRRVPGVRLRTKRWPLKRHKPEPRSSAPTPRTALNRTELNRVVLHRRRDAARA